MLVRTALRFSCATLASATLLSADLFAYADQRGTMMVLADGPLETWQCVFEGGRGFIQAAIA